MKPTSPLDVKILCILKIGKLEHLQQIQKGTLYCRSLNFYKSIEQKDKPHYDSNEGVFAVHQAKDVTLKIFNPKTGDKLEINHQNGLLNQVILTENLNKPIFCLHAIHTGEWTNKVIGQNELHEFMSYIKSFEKMKNFGSHVLYFKNANEFINRIVTASNVMRFGFTSRLVEYKDFTASSFILDNSKMGFVKSTKFSIEREFRIIFNGLDFPDPFRVNIGDLSDICEIVTLEEFLHTISVDFKK